MKNNRLLLIMGALISVALIVSIFVVYNYKNNQVNSASNEQPKSTETNKSTDQDSSTTEKTDTTPETPEKPEQQ
ncbi:MAG TPA: D-alanyl-D-alanine carboxypeptidase, partial [Lysinibacillus sp.]|nr:D-alanyl-D-alanine carboxypeptidase [Lysinibacillus sp.]